MKKSNRTYRNETDGLVKDGVRALRAGMVWSGELLVDALRYWMAKAVRAGSLGTLRELGVPGPLAAEMELTFGLIGRTPDGVSPTPLATAGNKGAPKTLRELGVPGSLAAEMELVLDMMGNVRDGRIVGYSFRAVNGVAHALRTEAGATGESKLDRAA